MNPAISVITLAVADVERAVVFYRDGLKLPVHEKPPVTYFALRGTWLAVFQRERLARFAGLPALAAGPASLDEASTGPTVTLSCNVASAREVDAALADAAAAGGQVVSAARQYSWGGYAGWFADPDGHAWEVVYNPRPFIGQQPERNHQ